MLKPRGKAEKKGEIWIYLTKKRKPSNINMDFTCSLEKKRIITVKQETF